jgi:hypothetical protein
MLLHHLQPTACAAGSPPRFMHVRESGLAKLPIMPQPHPVGDTTIVHDAECGKLIEVRLLLRLSLWTASVSPGKAGPTGAGGSRGVPSWHAARCNQCVMIADTSGQAQGHCVRQPTRLHNASTMRASLTNATAQIGSIHPFML